MSGSRVGIRVLARRWQSQMAAPKPPTSERAEKVTRRRDVSIPLHSSQPSREIWVALARPVLTGDTAAGRASPTTVPNLHARGVAATTHHPTRASALSESGAARVLGPLLDAVLE